ncbi:unnamed protein product [Meloidogyne enterolobii]|uniref:Uncharacterized protein n=1 Tax=Meloidogyne enterolobii TaxID=390850 RepID=A0ACB0Z2T4_MELEN
MLYCCSNFKTRILIPSQLIAPSKINYLSIYDGRLPSFNPFYTNKLLKFLLNPTSFNLTSVNSKTFFLVEAAAENPFGTEFFVWLDAGYGHGDRSIFPSGWKWQPKFEKGIISLIKLTPPTDLITHYNLQSLYRDISVISGGFLAGDRNSIIRLHQLYYKKFINLIEKQKVDDDQTMLVLLINEYPEFFHIYYGDWFDAFELF